MIKSVLEFFRRRKLQYVDTIQANTYYVDKAGDKIPGREHTTFWLLYESESGRRKYKTMWSHGSRELSPHATLVFTKVKIWKGGGPYPTGGTSEPRPSKPKPKHKHNLVTFPGGKK